MARSIPSSLAALVEHLELERKSTVTLEEISRIAEGQGLRTPGRIIAHRLARLGWLLPTPVRGTWEFAPAERPGAIPNADPLLPFRALLSASHRDLPAAVALGSALWIQDWLSDLLTTMRLHCPMEYPFLRRSDVSTAFFGTRHI